MIIFLVLGELIYIDKYTFEETTHCFIFILTCLCAIFINYSLRGVWSYNLVKLDRLSGWTLVSKTTIIMYLFSFVFYLSKSSFKKNGGWYKSFVSSLLKSKPFFTGMIGLIAFNIFLYFQIISVTFFKSSLIYVTHRVHTSPIVTTHANFSIISY